MFYIPGYDPFPARRYRELYRSQGELQAKISGYHLALRHKRGGDNYGWYVAAKIDKETVVSEFEVLEWADLVRASMPDTIVATYVQMARTFWVYLATGALRRLM